MKTNAFLATHTVLTLTKNHHSTFLWASLVVQMLKNLPAVHETWVRSLGPKTPWRREWQPTPVFLPGESDGQRSLAGYSPWGRRESDTIKRVTHIHTFSVGFTDHCSTTSSSGWNSSWSKASTGSLTLTGFAFSAPLP